MATYSVAKFPGGRHRSCLHGIFQPRQVIQPDMTLREGVGSSFPTTSWGREGARTLGSLMTNVDTILFT